MIHDNYIQGVILDWLVNLRGGGVGAGGEKATKDIIRITDKIRISSRD